MAALIIRGDRTPAMLRKLAKAEACFSRTRRAPGQKGRVCHIWWRRGSVRPGFATSASPLPTSSQPWSQARTMLLRS